MFVKVFLPLSALSLGVVGVPCVGGGWSQLEQVRARAGQIREKKEVACDLFEKK